MANAQPATTAQVAAGSSGSVLSAKAAKKTPAQIKAEKAAKKAKKLAKYCKKKKNAKKKKCRALLATPGVAVSKGGIYSITPSSKIIGKMAKYKTVNQYTQHYYLIRSYVQSFEAAGGGTLILGPGEYRLSSTIYVPSNTTIQLASGARIVKTTQTGTAKFSAADSLFMLIRPSLGKKPGAVGGHGGDSNINILGAADGTSVIDLAKVSNSLAVIAGHNQHVTISGITFKNMNNNHFIEMDACADCTISNNRFLEAAAGTRETAEAINLDTPDPKTKGFGSVWSNQDSTPNERVTVEGNLFQGIRRSVGTHNFSTDRYHTDIVVRNNTITDISDKSMVIMNWRNPVITGNTMSSAGVGIEACGTLNPTIQGNTFQRSSYAIRFRGACSGENGSTQPNEVSEANVAAMKDNVAGDGLGGAYADGVPGVGTVYFNGHEPPILVPNAPYIYSVQVGGTPGSAVVTWSQAYGETRAPILGYRVTAYEDPAGTVPVAGITNPIVVDGSTLSATFTGLAKGRQYWFRVSASNSAGEGAASSPTSLTIPDVPGVPTGITLSNPAYSSPWLTWTPPTATGGQALTGYRVYIFSDASGTSLAPMNGNPIQVTGYSTYASLSVLATATQAYWVGVAAVNSTGEGPVSSPLVAVIPVRAPTGVTAAPITGQRGKAQVSWTAPLVPPSQATGYRVSAYTDAAGTVPAPGISPAVVSATPPAVPPVTVTFSGLTSGQTYYFRVVATGTPEGPPSLPSAGFTAP